MSKQLIYVVEDDESIQELITYALTGDEFETQAFSDGKSLLSALETRLPELILLDLMLPDQSGLELLAIIRDKYKNVNIKVIILTAKSTEINKVTGLNAGADDYITKPFSVLELVARCKANLRRYSVEVAEGVLVFEGIRLDSGTREVTADGVPINLTYKEFELLRELMRGAGRVLEREKILKDIWGYEYFGESRTVDIHIKNLRGKLGRHGDCILSIRGVGYQLKPKKKNEKAAALQKDLLRQKQEFFSNAGHELNTPLASILGYAEMMLTSGKFERHFLESIYKEAQRMKLLIADMMTIAELEEKREFADAPLDVKEVADHILNMMAPKAQAKNITLTGDVESVLIVANREKITELVVNLVSNAVKYTNTGGTVTLKVRCENNQAVVSVKDSGIGIAYKHQGRIFERFYRVDKGRSRAEGGTGLGLAIVKHIANHYKAQISLVSAENIGTEVTVAFKLYKK